MTGARAIAGEAPDLPFYYYDIPVVDRRVAADGRFLAPRPPRIPNLAGVKFTNPDLVSYRRCLDVAGRRFDLPWGDRRSAARRARHRRARRGGLDLQLGAEALHRSDHAFARGDLDEARRLQSLSIAMVDAIAATGFMGTARR